MSEDDLDMLARDLAGLEAGFSFFHPGSLERVVRIVNMAPMLLVEVRRLRAQVAAAQRRPRPGKDYNACPYDVHADDCDCGGRAGDR